MEANEPEPTGAENVEEHAPRRRPWRWIRRTVLVVVVLPLTLYYTRDGLVHPALTWLIEATGPRLLGFEVDLEDLDSDWFRELELSGLRLRPVEDDSPLRELRVRRATVVFSLGPLVRGNLEGLQEIRVTGVHAEVDASSLPAGSEETPAPALPAVLPRVLLEHVAARVRLPGGRSLEVAEVAATLNEGVDEGSVDVRIPSVVFTQPDGTRHEATIEASAVYAPIEGGLSFAGVDATLRLTGEAREDAPPPAGGEALDLDALLTRLDELRSRAARELLPSAGALRFQGDVTVPLAASVALDVDGLLELTGAHWLDRTFSEASARARLAGSALSVERIEIVSGRSSLRGSSIELAFDSNEPLWSARGQLEAELLDLGRALDLPLGPLTDNELRFSVALDGGVVSISGGRLATALGSISLTSGRVELDLEHEEGPAFELNGSFEVTDIARLEELTGVAGSGRLSGDLRVEGRGASPTATLSLAGSGLTVAGLALDEIALEIRADPSAVDVTRLALRSPYGEASATGRYELAGSRVAAAVLDATLTQIEPWVRATGDAPTTLHAEVSGPVDDLAGTATLRGPGVDVRGVPLSDVDLRLGLEAGRLSTEACSLVTPWGALSANASVDLAQLGGELDVRIEALSWKGEAGDLALVEETRVRLDGSAFELPLTRLLGSPGAFYVLASGDASGFRGMVRSKGFDPTPMLREFLPVGLEIRGIDAECTVAVSDSQLQMTATGAVGHLAHPQLENPMRVDFGASLEEGRLRLQRFDARAPDGLALDVRGEIPLDLQGAGASVDGPISLRASIALPLASLPLGALGALETGASASGSIDGVLELGGTTREITGSLDIRAPRLVFDLDAADAGQVVASIDGRIVIDHGLRFEEFEARVDDATLVRVEGSADVPTSLDELLGRGASLLEAPLDLTVDARVRELGWAAELVPDLRRVAGQLAAQLHVEGPLSAPRVWGSVHLEDGEMRLAANLPRVENLRADLRLDGDTLYVERVEGELGASPLQLSGEVRLPTLEREMDVRLALSGENVLLQRTSAMRMRADLDLTITGPWSKLEVGGEVALRNCRIAQHVDLIGMLEGGGGGPETQRRGLRLFSLREPPLSNIRLDVRIRSAEPVVIVSNLARGNLHLDMRLAGTGEVPTPIGRVFLDETRVRLPGGQLNVQGGMVVFEERNPFVPVLDIEGSARLSGYDVRVHVTGDYDEPQVNLSTNPQLPNHDALMLVVTGQVPKESYTTAAAESLTLYLAKDFLSQLGGNGLDDSESLVDRVEVVQGREVSKSGIQTTEVSVRLNKRGRGPRQSFYLVGDRDVYDFYNMGFRIAVTFQ